MVFVDYGSVAKTAPGRSGQRISKYIFAAAVSLVCVMVISFAYVNIQVIPKLYKYDFVRFTLLVCIMQDDEDPYVTLAEMNAVEAREILQKAKHMSTAQLQAEVNKLESGNVARTTVLSEDTEANPAGAILEKIPSTIVAPVPGVPDFNGASAVIARLPNLGFAPSLLEEKGVESRGTFTVRQSRAGQSFYLRIYGKLNHNIRCTIRGYRNLMGDFTGNTIYTGYKLIFTGKSQIQTGHIPRGITGEFDIMTCRCSEILISMLSFM